MTDTKTLDAEVAVVGLGAMGAMAMWRLAERGVDVLGIEQFTIANEEGSSHGETRLFRTACFEHPGLAAMARRSLGLWRDLERSSGDELLRLSGGVMIGPPSSDLILGTAAASRAGGVAVEELSNAEIRERFPQHSDLAPHHVGLWDPEAGAVRPELGIRAAVATARALGAQVLERTRVADISEQQDHVSIVTAGRTYRVGQVIVATGPWLAKLMPTVPVQPTRVLMTWYNPRSEPEAFDIDRFPVFIRHIDDDRTMWGHGSVFGHPPKVGAPDDPSNFRPTDPDDVDRTVTAEDLRVGSEAVARLIHGLDPDPARAITCIVTPSPDTQFIVGRLDAGGRTLVAGGCSGHAFKHAPGIGELLAQLTVGDQPYLDASFVDPRRF